MNYVPTDAKSQEYVHHIDENAIKSPRSFININVAHEVGIVEKDFYYWLRVKFSNEEVYYIKCFDCEKAAKAALAELLNNK